MVTPWQARCASESDSAKRASAIAGIEGAPKRCAASIPSSSLATIAWKEALAAAPKQDDLAPFERLLEFLRQPYAGTPEQAPYAEPAPAALTSCYRTFCGT